MNYIMTNRLFISSISTPRSNRNDFSSLIDINLMSVINMSLSIGHLMRSKMKVYTQQQIAINRTFRAFQKHVLLIQTCNRLMFRLYMKNIYYLIGLNVIR